MELHPLNWQLLVSNPHDLMIIQGFCGCRENVWKASPFSYQRMVAGRLERVVDSLENAFPVMFDGAGLPMAELLGPDYSSSESMDYSLMAKAYA